MSGCGGWDSVNPLCRAGQVLGGAAKTAGNDVFGSIADYFAGVAKDAVAWLWNQLNDATSVDLTSAGIERDLVATGAIAAIIAFGLFVIQVIASTLRQDGAGLGRGVRGLAVSFIGAAFAVASTQILLAAVDGLCNGVVHFALHTNLQGLGTQLIAAQTLAVIGNPAGLLLMSLVIIAAVVVIWVAFMIRKLLIIVSAVFAPIAFAGAASDISRSWVRRWIEFTLALVFSKLILVIIFMIGLSVLNGAGQSSHDTHTTTQITTLIIGALTLLLAGFAPWIAIKMVHFAGESFHAVHAQAAGVTAGASSAVAVPQKVVALSKPYAAAAAGAAGKTAGGKAGAAGQPGAQAKSPASAGSASAPGSSAHGSGSARDAGVFAHANATGPDSPAGSSRPSRQPDAPSTGSKTSEKGHG